MLCPLTLYTSETAIATANETLTYKEAHRLTSGIHDALHKQGIREGTIVPFVPEKNIASILTFFALFRLGAIAAPISKYLPNAAGITPRLYPPSDTEAHLNPHLPATHLRTSGSTATPKTAVHTLYNHIYSALGVNTYFDLEPGDQWLLSMPLYHIAGIAILFRCFIAGATIALDSPYTHASWIPTHIPTLDPHLKKALLGGMPIPTQSDPRLLSSYGLTEMSSTVLIQNKRLPHREIKLVDQQLYVSGPTLFQGYLNEPAPTWFPTGDLFTPDLQFIGRKDRLFISGGENIQPEEIEKALLTQPNIHRAHVVPVPDPEYGMRPVAFIDGTYDDLPLEKFKHPIASFPIPEIEGKVSLKDLASLAKKLIVQR